jgi:YVTN family beta-propeller protein
MIIENVISCLYGSQRIVALLLILIIYTPITTVVFIPYDAAAQRLTRTLKNGTSDLGIVVHVGDAGQSSHIGDNKTGSKQPEILNQQLSAQPNSGAINEQAETKTSSSKDLRTIGKTGQIALRGEPTSIGINPNANLIYISQSLDRQPYTVITVIDGKTNSVVKDIDVMPDPQDIALNPNTNMIYVTHLDSNVVSVIDGKTNSVIKAIATGIHPQGVAVNPNTNMIYVTNSADDITSVIDGKTNSVIKAIATGLDPAGLAVNPNTNMIYVGNIGSNTLSIIDGKTNSVVKDLKNLSAAEIAVNPLTNIIYTGSTERLCIINGKTNSVEKNITRSETNSISINENTNKIYITALGNGFGNSTASIIDGKTNSVVKEVNLNSNSTKIAVNSLDNLIYIILPKEHKIVVSDSNLSAFASTNKIGSRIGVS